MCKMSQEFIAARKEKAANEAEAKAALKSYMMDLDNACEEMEKAPEPAAKAKPEFPKDKSDIEMLIGYMKSAERLAEYALKLSEITDECERKLENARENEKRAADEANAAAEAFAKFADSRSLFWMRIKHSDF